MLTHIFSPTDCASCKLCCHFHRRSAWETPSLNSELIYLLQEECVPMHQRPDGSTTFYLHFCTDSENETADCPMLNRETGCTLPRELRPFECRIWPLRLLRKNNQLVIGLYENCPALQNGSLDELVKFATGEFLTELLEHAKRFPKCVREYHDDYRIIYEY